MLFKREVLGSLFSGFLLLELDLLLLLLGFRDGEGSSSPESESCLEGFLEEDSLVDFEAEEDLELGAMIFDVLVEMKEEYDAGAVERSVLRPLKMREEVGNFYSLIVWEN